MADRTFIMSGQRYTETEPGLVSDQSPFGWQFIQNVGNVPIMVHTKFQTSYEEMNNSGMQAGVFLGPGDMLNISSAGTVYFDTASGDYPIVFAISEPL